MAIHYHCRHCKVKIGSLESVQSTEILGFHHLTSDERSTMLTHDSNGDIQVKVICEDCHEALTQNPEFYQLDTIIQ
ncbi:anti-sigma-F factor Fin family protein [Halalkalibacterium ligniniphilum]|uniref:anti-sigma-F factor Fin family protein n=1 Tax=Halalkalibacterium ligniniphilum TaxID=1134413 RepID=UPI00034BFE8C|nr:anti-sigma-F factor Fin family protein [Halalkalibacterium ligniniphilum]